MTGFNNIMFQGQITAGFIHIGDMPPFRRVMIHTVFTFLSHPPGQVKRPNSTVRE